MMHHDKATIKKIGGFTMWQKIKNFISYLISKSAIKKLAKYYVAKEIAKYDPHSNWAMIFHADREVIIDKIFDIIKSKYPIAVIFEDDVKDIINDVINDELKTAKK